MPQAIVYCDRCGKMIPPGEISRGQAIVGDEGGVCPSCAALLSDDQRDALTVKLTGAARSAPSVARDTPSRQVARGTPSSHSTRRASARMTGTRLPPEEPESGGGLSSQMVIIGVIVMVVIGVGIALFVSSQGTSTPKQPAPGLRTTTPKAPPKKPVDSPAKIHLAKIQTMAKSMPGSYREVMTFLKEFPSSFPGAPEVTKSQALIPVYEKQLATLADRELAKAFRDVKTRVDGGRAKEAAPLLVDMRVRFTGTKWFETRGEKALDKATKEIEATIEGLRVAALETHAKDTVARAEKLFKQKDFVSAKSILGERESWPQPWRNRAKEIFRDATKEQLRIAAAVAKELKRKEAWRQFLVKMNATGTDGLAALEKHFSANKILLTKLGKVKDLSRFSSLLRQARNVEDLAEIALSGGRRRVKLRWKGEVVEGRVRKTKNGIIFLQKTRRSKILEIPIGELAPASVVDDAGIKPKAYEAAAYFLMRGDLEEARKRLGVAAGAKASALSECIEEIVAALAAPVVEIAPEPAAIPAADDASLKFPKPLDDAAAAKKATVGGMYSNLLKKIAVKNDFLKNGEFTDYGSWDAATYRGHTGLPAGYWVYVFPNWYIFEMKDGKKAPPPEVPTAVVAEGPSKPLPRGPKKPLPGETGKPGDIAPGVICEIFKGTTFDERVGVRIDPQIDFLFESAPPDLGLPEGTYTLRWTGYFLAHFDGLFKIEPENLAVKIDGKAIPNKNISMVKGLHKFTAVGTTGAANKGAIRLRWKPIGLATIPVPSSHFFHEVPASGSMGPFAKVIQGLSAKLYAGETPKGGALQSTYSKAEFDLGDRAPCSSLQKDRFSVRLEGYLLAAKTGIYGFKLEADDGGQFFINGERKIDSWMKAAKDPTARIQLKAGFHKITLLHRDRNSKARLRLLLRPPGSNKDVSIAENLLFREPGRSSVSSRKGLSPGINCVMYKGERPGGEKIFERLDPHLELDWAREPPGLGVPATNFCATWKGSLVVPKSGLYIFRIQRRGGVILTVGSTVVINSWKNNAASEVGRPVNLRAGTTRISLAYFNKQKGPAVKVHWSGPNFMFRKLERGDLVHKSKKIVLAAPWQDPPKAVAAAPKAAGGKKPPPPAGGTVAKPPPAKNLVLNGGFEEKDANRKFAARWMTGQWGKRGSQYSVRVDMSNPHGDSLRAIVARTIGEGAKAGASTSLKLAAGTYRVSYWACAKIGQTAAVSGHFGGSDLPESTVGDEWKQFTHEVEVKKKTLRGALRIWTSSPNARVWFDDVEVVLTMLTDLR